MNTIRGVAITVHELAVRKGWWPTGVGKALKPNDVLAKLALVHSEVSEALEIARETFGDLGDIWFKGEEGSTPGPRKPEGFGIELADVVIRVFDLAEALGIDIEKCIALKHEYNLSRSQRHGGKAA